MFVHVQLGSPHEAFIDIRRHPVYCQSVDSVRLDLPAIRCHRLWGGRLDESGLVHASYFRVATFVVDPSYRPFEHDGIRSNSWIVAIPSVSLAFGRKRNVRLHSW